MAKWDSSFVQDAFQFEVLIRFDRQIMQWIARGVNYDIVAQAPTLGALREAFERAIVAQIMCDMERGQAPLADCPKAPDHVRHQFEAGQPYSTAHEFQVPEPYQIAARLQEMRIND
jgi:hypothetical protein